MLGLRASHRARFSGAAMAHGWWGGVAHASPRAQPFKPLRAASEWIHPIAAVKPQLWEAGCAEAATRAAGAAAYAALPSKASALATTARSFRDGSMLSHGLRARAARASEAL